MPFFNEINVIKILTMDSVGVFILPFLFSGTLQSSLFIILTSDIKKLDQAIFLLHGKEANAYANHLN